MNYRKSESHWISKTFPYISSTFLRMKTLFSLLEYCIRQKVSSLAQTYLPNSSDNIAQFKLYLKQSGKHRMKLGLVLQLEYLLWLLGRLCSLPSISLPPQACCWHLGTLCHHTAEGDRPPSGCCHGKRP